MMDHGLAVDRDRRQLVTFLTTFLAMPSTLAATAPSLLSMQLGNARVHRLAFDVTASVEEQRVVFSELRTRARIATIELLDPSGRQAWRRSASELRIIPRAVATHPEWGDAIVLPEARDAIRGRWQLVIEREAPYDAAAVTVGYAVLERFELGFTGPTTIAAGQAAQVFVSPLDYGAPLAGLQPIVVVAQDAAGVRVASVPAIEAPRSASGIVLTSEPGAYGASFRFDRPGLYQLTAAVQFQGRSLVRKSATLALTVTAASASIELRGMRFEPGQSGCARGVWLDFAANVAVAGTYSCSVALVAGATPVSTSAQLQPGGNVLSLWVTAKALRVAAPSLAKLERVALLHFAPAGIRVVAEAHAVVLGTPVDASNLCK